MRFLPRILAIGLLFAGPPALAQPIAGGARVIDALTLEVAGQVLRLQDIAAPLPGQRCTLRGARRDCGALAATQLMDLAFGARVICAPLGPAESGMRPARCSAAGYDLATGMVHSGWARALPGAAPELALTEARARAAGRGLWRDGFPAAVTPASGD